MPDMILLELEEKMEKTISNLKKEFNTVRTGRANPSVLDGLTISYWGVETPIKQVASISVPEATQLYIKPFDKSSLKDIERAINASDLGITPQGDGVGIRLVFPSLTEQRRKELVKQVYKMGENSKIALRNERRHALDALKKLALPEDEEKAYQEEVQKVIDKYVEKTDAEVKVKEKDLLNI